MSLNDVTPAPVVAQARKEAKRLLRLAKARGWPEPNRLTEAMDVVAQLKGQVNWQALVAAPRQPALSLPDPARIHHVPWWTAPMVFKGDTHLPAPWAWGDRIAIVGDWGTGKTLRWFSEVVSQWAHPSTAPDRLVVISAGESIAALSKTLSQARPKVPPFFFALDHAPLYDDWGTCPDKINVLGLPFGTSLPTGDHRAALVALLCATVTAWKDRGKDQASSGSRRKKDDYAPVAGSVLDATYRWRQTEQKECQTGLNSKLDTVVNEQRAFGHDEQWWKLSWAKLSALLMPLGYDALARVAHQQAMPTWADLCVVAEREASLREDKLQTNLAKALRWVQETWDRTPCFGDWGGNVDWEKHPAILFDLDITATFAEDESAPQLHTDQAKTLIRLWAEAVACQAIGAKDKALWVFDESDHRLDPSMSYPLAFKEPSAHRLTVCVHSWWTTSEDLAAWDQVIFMTPKAANGDVHWKFHLDEGEREKFRNAILHKTPEPPSICLSTRSPRLTVGRWHPAPVHFWLMPDAAQALLKEKTVERWGLSAALAWMSVTFPTGKVFSSQREAATTFIRNHPWPIQSGTFRRLGIGPAYEVLQVDLEGDRVLARVLESGEEWWHPLNQALSDPDADDVANPSP